MKTLALVGALVGMIHAGHAAAAETRGMLTADWEIAQTAVKDACSLFTVEEAGKAVGRTFRRARPQSAADGSSCAFAAGSGDTYNVTVSTAPSKQRFDDFRALLVEQGEKVDPVRGVGDDAFFWGARIYARVGNTWLVIWNGNANQPEEKGREEVLALAKLGVTKLGPAK